MEIKLTRTLLAFVMGALISLPSAIAATIFSDNFESYTTGNNVGASTNWNTDNGGGTTNILNSNDFGPTNKFVQFNDSNTGDFVCLVNTTTISAGQAFTFSLDFIGKNDQGISIGLSAGTAANQALGSDRILRANLTNGAISGDNPTNGFGGGFFTLNTAYELKLVVNDSGAAINYANRSLADNAYDVWIRDLADTGSTYVGTGTFTSAAQYHTVARSFNGPTPNYYFDNWSVDQGAIVTPVPEPTAALLGGIGLLLLLRRRR